MDQKTVFLSYRRDTSKHLARAIYLDLKGHDWDVFLDVTTIDSGDFDRIILNQIGARAHFILLISDGSLDRCAHPGDWVRREIAEAVRLERNIVPVIEEGADFNRELGYLPDDLQAALQTKNGLPLPHFFFEAAMEMLRNRFLKAPEYVPIEDAPAADAPEVQRRLAQADSAVAVPWVAVTDFQIAQYPTTNAQFAAFIDAGGYQNPAWWTEYGWAARQKEGWTQPRLWGQAGWGDPDRPVVGVSWYEALAFCLWMSATTGEKIMLPTEDQWQLAAAGDDGRAYPWGDDWDCERCNSGVPPCASGATSPVTQYEGRGNSPFGAVDMAGNVWEWCLTDYETGRNLIHQRTDTRVLRGGSWMNTTADEFRCDYRYWDHPHFWLTYYGFRVVRQS